MQTMQTVLDKRLPTPLYHQLKFVILNAIQAGQWKADDQLPTETELAEAYHVSKITVREALRDLAEKGYVRREQGRGTFVARTQLEQGPRELTSFTEEMRRRGYRASSRVLARGVIHPPAEIAEKLNLAKTDPVLELRRLRLANHLPMAVQTAYVPLLLAPGLARHSFATRSLYEILRTEYRLAPARATETHYAIAADAATAALLGIPKGSPVMAAERVTFLAGGRPLEVVESVMRSDRYRIVLELVSGDPEVRRS
jgi:GntR family transcriptional regulator, N-acetylglucosamine utilization regulator